jgi:4-amino-4-deoxy-L-arabinose transferase-like glycosyltransferase
MVAVNIKDLRDQDLHKTFKRTLVVILMAFFSAMLVRSGDGPNGFHKWRESDTAAVAANFFGESWDFLAPRVDQRGSGSGIAGMELPVYNYAVALSYAASGGINHRFARVITAVGGVVALIGVWLCALQILGSVPAALASVAFVALSPLFFFYSRKIQPDVWALAFALHGLHLYMRSGLADRGRWLLQGIAAGLLLALAGSIKPTFLCFGASMLAWEWHRASLRQLFSLRNLVVAILAIVPVFAWIHFAQSVNFREGVAYFAVALDLSASFAALQTTAFWQNVFLTWLWEMQIGLPMAWVFVYGCYKIRQRPEPKIFLPLLSWVCGALLIFALVATHTSTPHDYYTLPIVPPLAMITAIGFVAALENRRIWLRRAALASAVLMLAYTPLRLKDRYGKPYDFHAGRTVADHYLDRDALVVAYDNAPGVLLYRIGRKGWFVPNGSKIPLEDISRARYLVTQEGMTAELLGSVLASRLLERIYDDQGLVVFGLAESPPQ